MKSGLYWLILSCLAFPTVGMAAIQTPPALEAKYENKEHGFSINYPAKYSKEKPRPKEVFRARSKDRLPLLTISIVDIEEGTTFAKLKDIYLNAQKVNSITDVKFMDEKEIAISDGVIPAFMFVVEYKVGEYALKTLNLWVVNRDKWILVAATTVPQLWPRHKDEMKAIVYSFAAPKWKSVLKKASVTPDVRISVEIHEKAPKSKVIDPERYNRLKHEFRSMIEKGLHPGAQLAVYHNGELVIHLAGGVKGPGGEYIMTSSDLLDWRAGKYKRPNVDPITGPGGDPVTFDTLYQIRSVTKILSMTVMMMLYDQGKLDFDDPVAKYWPAFAKNGKETVTIADILSHRSGLPYGPNVPAKKLSDRTAIARAIEDMHLVETWKKSAYHGLTIGMVPDEIVYRLAGKYPPTGYILRKEVFQPLGLKDMYLPLPASEYPRMAKMTVLAPQSRGRKKYSDLLNSKWFIQIEQSWVGCVSTAKDLANFMNIFAYEGTYKGKRFFSKKVQKLVSTPTTAVGEIDVYLKYPIRWGIGFMLADTPKIYGSKLRPGVIGHVGGGANIAWADPKNNLAVAFLCNGMRNQKAIERFQTVADLVYAALNLNE